MAAKKKQNISDNIQLDVPKTLTDHPFFGLILDEDQRKLVDAVWSREHKVYMVDSAAGVGKTLISTALGLLMYKYGIVKRIVYVTFPGIQEGLQGYLPGTLLEKSEPYFQPLYDALIKLGELPDHVCNTSQVAEGMDFVQCAVATYMRGINLEDSFVILDESENADMHTLAKVLTRVKDDNCVVMVIGHSGQCDLVDKSKSGFTAAIDYCRRNKVNEVGIYHLYCNHRGFVSEWADLMLGEYEKPQYGFVYMTKNTKNGKLYIGKHKRSMDENDIDDSWYLGSGVALQNAILEFGEESFERTILYECSSKDQLDYMEEKFLCYYDAVGDENFYNIVSAHKRQPRQPLSEEQKEHMRHPHRPMRDEARKNMRRELSEEARKIISEKTRSHLTGYKHSDQSKENMRKAHAGYRPVYKDGVFKVVKNEAELAAHLNDGWVKARILQMDGN